MMGKEYPIFDAYVATHTKEQLENLIKIVNLKQSEKRVMLLIYTDGISGAMAAAKIASNERNVSKLRRSAREKIELFLS